MKIAFVIVIFLNCLLYATCARFDIDPNGYIAFCPCMGRFGNQAEQFLGALQFAKDLERTLVLPHWVEYPDKPGGSDQIPFQKYFKVEPLQNYTKVILMDDFMKYLAPKVWPKGKRTVFCWSFRENSKSCKAKEGNPFGPYWDKFGIDFDRDEQYEPFGFDLAYKDNKKNWKKHFPSSKYPVLAFTGAPGSFPILEKNIPLQKYLKWSDAVEKKADEFIAKMKKSPKDKFVAIHLRNGVDFKTACEHAKEIKDNNFFASAQCLGYGLEKGSLTEELCFPTDEIIFEQLGKALEKTKIQIVYVASDHDFMIEKFQKKFENVKFFKYDSSDAHVDAFILGRADHAIINCVSTFSAFVKRQRDAEGKKSEFWAFKPDFQHSEL